MTFSPLALVIIIILLALWLVGAGWAMISGLTMRRRAKSQKMLTRRLSYLIDESPAQPVLVRSDGRMEGAVQLGKWLGLDKLPHQIADCQGANAGFDDQAMELLHAAIDDVRKTGNRREEKLSLIGTSKRLLCRVVLANPNHAPANAVLLWFYDITESEQTIADLIQERDQAKTAFAALSGLIEAAPIPMWYRSADLRLALVNSAYVSAVGAKTADDVITTAIELVEPVDGVTPMAAAARAAKQGAPQSRQLGVTIDGVRRTMQIVDVPIAGQGVAGYAIDIQELAELRENFRRFRGAQRDMLDRLSAGVALFDREMRLTFCNQPFQRIFAMRPEWLNAEPEFDRLLDRMREVGTLPEIRDYPEWRKQRRDWFRSTDTQEEDWNLRGGSHVRIVAHPNPDGSLILICEDRTEQLKLASARDTLLRVRTASFDNLFEAVAVFAPDGRLNLWNRSFGSIWDIEEDMADPHPQVDDLLKTLATRLKRPALISELRRAILATSSSRKEQAGRIIMQDSRHFEFATVPLPDGNVLLTMLDITDSQGIEQALRDRNQALVEADGMKTQFLANMSYEFRTPLTSIQGFAELLSNGLAGPLPEEAKTYVAAILESVERLSTQINTVLDLSQSEAGTLPLSKQSVSATELLQNVIASHQVQINSTRKGLEQQLPDQDLSIKVDVQRLSQALDHVIDNSIQHVGDDGRLLVRLQRSGRYARFIISDNGPGMEPELVSSINDGLAHQTEENAGKRQGLGLALARHLVLAHEGRFELLSEAGQGVVVVMDLPL